MTRLGWIIMAAAAAAMIYLTLTAPMMPG